MTTVPRGKIIIISGPTASGKSTLAIEVGKWIKQNKHCNPAIINFDSLCFYHELNIGTAKPTKSERQEIEHFMIDIASAKHPLTSADYVRATLPIIHNLHSQNRPVILVGGSAFYLRALIKGMYEMNEDQESNLHETSIYGDLTTDQLWQELVRIDPQSAKKLHPNDRYRVQRALDFNLKHGHPISAASKQIEDPYDFSKACFEEWQLIHFYLDWPKEMLLKRIEERALKMFQDGLVDEHQQLKRMGFSGLEKPMQSIGHLQVGHWLEGLIKSQQECQERIIIATRQLAKSQRTFFNKISPKHKIAPEAIGQIYRHLDVFFLG